ncbi:MAG: nitroreductase family protein [Deltaproteobacteria bacterium]|nr:nitroreductase family protein [Deltaproteobacteria bacterium]MBW2086892.1 nitroreductase family protein [Deltaproteobacteria bacterium]
MDTIEAIKTRRSIRSWKDRPVPDNLVREILGAAMYAPSAVNRQPWQLVMITDRQLLDKIPEINPYAAIARKAPMGIMVCGDLHLDMYGGYWPLDCSALTQNLLLAAHAKGLGAVWTGVYPGEDRVQGFQRLLNLPQHVVPLALVLLGYPAESPGPEDRFREDRIHYNQW